MRHCHAARIAAFCACVSGCNAFMPHLLALPLHKSPVGLRQYAARPRMVRGGLHLRCDTNPLPQESKGCSWDRVWKGAKCPWLFMPHLITSPFGCRMQNRPGSVTEAAGEVSAPGDVPGAAFVDTLAIPDGVVCDGKGVCVLAEEPECIEGPEGDCLVPGPLTTPQQYWGPRLILLVCCVLYGTNFAFGRLLNDSLDASVVSGHPRSFEVPWCPLSPRPCAALTAGGPSLRRAALLAGGRVPLPVPQGH